MAVGVQHIPPTAPLPLVLGVLRRLAVATVIDPLIPPHPAHGLSCGRGVEACIFHGCLPPSPWEGCHSVHMKPATQSTGRLPPNPWESCHPVHVKPATWTTGRLPPMPGETCLSRSAATLGGLVLFHRCSFCQPRLPFPHGFALQRNLVGVMDQAVEDCVGQRRIPQGLMPVLDRQLTGHQGGPTIMAVFDDLQQVAAVFITEGGQTPIIQ